MVAPDNRGGPLVHVRAYVCMDDVNVKTEAGRGTPRCVLARPLTC